MVSLGVKTHGRDSLRTRDVQRCPWVPTDLHASRARNYFEGGVKFEFDGRRAMTEMTAIYTVCLHTVQTVPWYR